MDYKTKNGYVAGGIFAFAGVIISLVSLDQGLNSGNITLIIGLILLLLGGFGIWKPKGVGQVIAHYLKQLSENQKQSYHKQSQYKTKNSNQAGRDIYNIKKRIYISKPKRRRK